MQGVQTESRFRGIGRYTLSLAQAIARNRGDHEIFLALSGLFPDTISHIKAHFHGLLPSENILIWHAPGPVSGSFSKDRIIAELIREEFFINLNADFLIVSSLFEGFGDNAVTSIGRLDSKIPTAVILYDLIPFLNQENYLTPDPNYKKYYLEKIEYLKSSDVLFSISDYSKKEAELSLDLINVDIVSISTAADQVFTKRQIDSKTKDQLWGRFNIISDVILYTGGADDRKNLSILIEAYSKLPDFIRCRFHLVIVGKIPQNSLHRLKDVASKNKITKDELIFTGYVDEETLVNFYNLSKLFVFPSWHEGFGLPVLEAMSCGLPVLASNRTSLPEVVGLNDVLFDPFDSTELSNKMQRILTDDKFSGEISAHGLEQSKKFSWDLSAVKAIESLESMNFCMNKGSKYEKKNKNLLSIAIYEKLICYISNYSDSKIMNIAHCLDSNLTTSHKINNHP
jgi:glycosyltransferase involved in cell wall biosynthesis